MATFEMNLKDNTKNLYNIKLNENISMTLKKISDSVAIVFFTCDIENNKINIPEGLTIYDNTNNKNLGKFTNSYFTLCWTDSYTIRYNVEIILDIVSKHSWNLNLPANRQMVIL